MNEKRARLVLLGAALAGFAMMAGFERAALGGCGHASQLQLQFAWSADGVQEVLDCWGESGAAGVVAGLYADFLFLAAYAPLLALVVIAAGREYARAGHIRAGARFARPLAAAQLVAGALDAIENLMILGIIAERVGADWALAVGLVASAKFALIAAGVCYAGVAVAVSRWRRRAA